MGNDQKPLFLIMYGRKAMNLEQTNILLNMTFNQIGVDVLTLTSNSDDMI